MKNLGWMGSRTWLCLLLVSAMWGKGLEAGAEAAVGASGPPGYQQSEPMQVSQYIRRMFQDRAGNLWFGTRDAGLSRFDGRAFAQFPLKAGANGGYVWTLLADRAGMLWVGMVGDGLYRYDGQSFTHFSKADGRGSAHVQSLPEDREGTLWVGTSGGVYRYDGKTFSNFTRAEVER